MHDSSTATLNKVDYQQEDYRRVDFLQVNYHQVEEKSGHIGVLSLNNHQVDYLQLTIINWTIINWTIINWTIIEGTITKWTIINRGKSCEVVTSGSTVGK